MEGVAEGAGVVVALSPPLLTQELVAKLTGLCHQALVANLSLSWRR